MELNLARKLLDAWGRWECQSAVEWVPSELPYPSRTAESRAGEAPSASFGGGWTRQIPEPPAAVVLVRRAIQGMPRHQLGALRRRYVPLEAERHMPSRHARYREGRLLERAERTVAMQVARMLDMRE